MFVDNCAKLIARELLKLGVTYGVMCSEGFCQHQYIDFLFDKDMYDKYGTNHAYAYKTFYDLFADKCYNNISMSQREAYFVNFDLSDDDDLDLANVDMKYSADELVRSILYNDPDLGIDMISTGELAEYLLDYI